MAKPVRKTAQKKGSEEASSSQEGRQKGSQRQPRTIKIALIPSFSGGFSSKSNMKTFLLYAFVVAMMGSLGSSWGGLGNLVNLEKFGTSLGIEAASLTGPGRANDGEKSLAELLASANVGHEKAAEKKKEEKEEAHAAGEKKKEAAVSEKPAKEEEHRHEAGEKETGEKKEEEPEEEEPNIQTISVAAMLCGAMTFAMAMFYLVNHPNSDMKRYAWQTMSSTISIFIAVLTFQGVNGMIKEFVIQEDTPNELGFWATTLVGFVQQWVWLGLLFVVLERCATSDAEGDGWEKELDEQDKALIELNMNFFATIFAHINGFAAINSFAELQQEELFKENFVTAFVMVPIALVYTTIVFKCLDKYRERIEESSGKNEERSEIWNEGAEDAEDDIGSLAISFLWAQSIRYMVRGYMPNAEGVSTAPEKITMDEALMQFAICFVLAFGILIVNKSIGDAPSIFNFKQLSETEKKFAHFFSHILGMTFAWVLLYTTTEAVSHIDLNNPVLSKVIVALLVSVVAFIAISLLEVIEHKAEVEAADDIKHGQVKAGLQVEDNMKALGQLILSIGILIGFSWEKAFDEALDAISEVDARLYQNGSTYGKSLENFSLTFILVLIVAPAWRLYIIPTVKRLEELYADQINEEFGIEVNAKDLEGIEGGGIAAAGDVVEEVADKLEEEVEAVFGLGGGNAAVPRKTAPTHYGHKKSALIRLSGVNIVPVRKSHHAGVLKAKDSGSGGTVTNGKNGKGGSSGNLPASAAAGGGVAGPVGAQGVGLAIRGRHSSVVGNKYGTVLEVIRLPSEDIELSKGSQDAKKQPLLTK